MPSRLTFEAYGDGLGEAATVLRANAAAMPLDTPVPTCPGWTVRDLVVHQGMVHRWARDLVTGAGGDVSVHEAAGRASTDLLGWFDEGATALLGALAAAPPDLAGRFFLHDAPPLREAWARRQCHETTVHAIDAMSARLGRPPTAAEAWFSRALAADGVDELLGGFLPRRKTLLRVDPPLRAAIESTDTGDAWTIELSDRPPVTSAGGTGPVDARIRAGAADLYLGLWNRADRLTSDDPRLLDRWRALMTVTW